MSTTTVHSARRENNGATAVANRDATAATAAATTLTGTDIALLVIRLALGVIFVAHGAQKVLGWWGGPGLGGTVQFMGGMGIPAPLAYLAAFTELLGGLAVIAGVLTRLASLGLFVTMAVAVALVHGQNGFFSSDKGFEYNLALAGMALALAIAGPGRIALGDWEPRLWRR